MSRSLILLSSLAILTGCKCGQSEPSEVPVEVPVRVDATPAFEAATDRIHATLQATRVADADDARRHIDAALASGDPDAIRRTMQLLPPGPRTNEDFQRQTRALEALGRGADVRAAAVTRSLRHPDDPEARRAAAVSWVGAAELRTGVTTWSVDEGRFLQPFHGSSSIIFKWRDATSIHASFKPRQTIRRQYFRSEVAAFRLNTILGLEVRIPPSTEVQLSWDDFHTLAGIEPGDETFHQTNARIEWSGEGESRFVRGVAKTWIRDLERFPIEYSDVWMPWLDGTADLAWMRETQASRALDGLRDRPREHYDNVVRAAGQMPVFRLAHQLSDLHVLDVLINNYDRYQPEGLQLGMNCHIQGESLVSLDNGAGFPTRDDHDWRRVRRKIENVRRFSRSTWLMLNALDPVALRPALFDDTDISDAEDERFDYFVERWTWMVDHIGGLIEEHGEATILVFP